MNDNAGLYQLEVVVPEKAIECFEGALDPYASAVSMDLIEEGKDKKKWKVSAIFETMPDKGVIASAIALAATAMKMDEPEWKITSLAPKNWLKESYQNFPPLDLGHYYIYGSHIEKPVIKEGQVALKIDAATAFGSGKHATTQGCLMAFDDMIKQHKKINSILDMGCGSGILAMAAAKVLKNVDIDAVDIDPESVAVTKKNIVENDVAFINVFQSTGYQNVTKQYDLVFANILARPLIDMSADLHKHLKAGGIAILSGFLTHQKSWVVKAHQAQGLSFVKDYKIKEWGTAIVKKD